MGHWALIRTHWLTVPFCPASASVCWELTEPARRPPSKCWQATLTQARGTPQWLVTGTLSAVRLAQHGPYVSYSHWVVQCNDVPCDYKPERQISLLNVCLSNKPRFNFPTWCEPLFWTASPAMMQWSSKFQKRNGYNMKALLWLMILVGNYSKKTTW